MKSIFVLSVFCLMSVFSGCGNMKFQSNENPADKVIKLDTPGESPKGKDQDYKIGGAVSVIRNDGVFEVEGRISKICEKLIFVDDFFTPGKKIWKPLKPLQNVQGNEKIALKGYEVGIRKVRKTEYEWYPPPQIFPAPWANNVNLKVGDTIL